MSLQEQIEELRVKLAELEAKAAEPFAEAKVTLRGWNILLRPDAKDERAIVARYVDHLEEEIVKRPIVWVATDRHGSRRLFETLEQAQKCGFPVEIKRYTGEKE